MDATTSFVYLTDNLPKWIEQVKDLSTHASNKHAEYVAEYNRRLANINPKKERTPSLQSNRTEPGELHKPPPQILEPSSELTPELSTADALHISPLEAGNKYILAQAQRKRKLGSSIRSGGSGPPKFRSKHMVVIYYDAYLQEQLEASVKSIGAARNNLRKGKLARSATRLFQPPSLTRDIDTSIPSFHASKKSPISSIHLPPDPKIALSDHKPTGDAAFTAVDKHLEEAQTLCETAAHQVLRDGDCSIELKNVVGKLQSAFELATATVAQLREEDAEGKQTEEEGHQARASVDTAPVPETSSLPSLSQSSSSKLIPSLNEKVDYSSRVLTTNPCAVTEIEVDDGSDQSSIVVDISKFRSTRAGSRGLRL